MIIGFLYLSFKIHLISLLTSMKRALQYLIILSSKVVYCKSFFEKTLSGWISKIINRGS